MNQDDTDPEIGELEFLMTRYDRIIDSYMTINQIIHTTFYISVVAIAGTAGVIPQFHDVRSRAVLYIAASFLFIAMYGWTKTYLTTRRALDEGTDVIVDYVEQANYSYPNVAVEDFFSRTEEYNREWWEPRKEDFLKLYYIGGAGIAVVALIIDLWFTISAGGCVVCLP